jgi:hypothetical protein
MPLKHRPSSKNIKAFLGFGGYIPFIYSHRYLEYLKYITLDAPHLYLI